MALPFKSIAFEKPHLHRGCRFLQCNFSLATYICRHWVNLLRRFCVHKGVGRSSVLKKKVKNKKCFKSSHVKCEVWNPLFPWWVSGSVTGGGPVAEVSLTSPCTSCCTVWAHERSWMCCDMFLCQGEKQKSILCLCQKTHTWLCVSGLFSGLNWIACSWIYPASDSCLPVPTALRAKYFGHLQTEMAAHFPQFSL